MKTDDRQTVLLKNQFETLRHIIRRVLLARFATAANVLLRIIARVSLECLLPFLTRLTLFILSRNVDYTEFSGVSLLEIDQLEVSHSELYYKYFTGLSDCGISRSGQILRHIFYL